MPTITTFMPQKLNDVNIMPRKKMMWQKNMVNFGQRFFSLALHSAFV